MLRDSCQRHRMWIRLLAAKSGLKIEEQEHFILSARSGFFELEQRGRSFASTRIWNFRRQNRKLFADAAARIENAIVTTLHTILQPAGRQPKARHGRN